MIKTDFVNVKGIEWGKYPYYYGDTYSDGNVYFATFGCKKAIQYKDFVAGDKTISEKTDYLSMYNNGGLKKYYGEDIFQQKKSLVSRDDFIRTEEKFYAIPTEEELQKLIDNSDIYCYNGKLIIKPYEMNDGIKNYKDEISIPFLGLIEYEYIADTASTTEKYNVIKGGIKQVGIGFHEEINPSNWNNVPPDGYPFVIIQKDGSGNIYRYDCYEYGFYYSDIYLLTSSIPKYKDGNNNGETFARVLRIEIEAKTLDDDPSTPEYGDVEFLSFEIKVDSEGKRLIYFDDIKCCDGTTSTYKDRGFMVLPIKYEGVVNVNITGNLLLNGIPFLGYNQDANKDVVPYIKINPFGIPKIENSKYNYTFSKDISDGSSILETSFYLPNGTPSYLSDIIEITKIDSDKAKIKNLTGENGNYWILSNNECLYSYPKNSRIKQIIFDDRSFFSREEKTTTINITINTRFKDNYTVGYNRFVLPSIYKPFYIKSLIGVEVFPEGYNETFVTTTQTNVYNGIGLFAYRGIGHSPNASGSILDKESESTSNKTQSLPNDLKEKLDSYFDMDNRFSKEFEFFYNPYFDTYAIGLIYSNVKISKSDNTLEYDCSNDPLPIFRQKPLILSNYNDSVFDFVDVVKAYDPSDDYRNNTRLKINQNFNSVIEPNKKMKFNSERGYSIDINFGELFGNIKGSLTSIFDVHNNINDIIQEGRKKGIRYYMVNEAFYLNYVYNYSNDEETDEATGFIKYSGEYYNNREYYDLNPHKVDFKHTSIWDNTIDVNGSEYHYIPFFDMIPALKNTVGYLYSDVKYKDYGEDNEKIDEDKPNFNAPMAAEIYYFETTTVHGEPYIGVANKGQCIQIDGNNNTCDSIEWPLTNTYLIGAYTPLTRLNGGCSTDDFEYDENDNDYVNHIKYGNVILPQEDEVSIIFCYGLIDGNR